MSDQMQKFVYVFDKSVRNELVSAGFEILTDNQQINTYVFVNKEGVSNYLGNCTCLFTDTLVFSSPQ